MLEEQVVAQAPNGIARALFLAQHTETRTEVAHHPHQRQHDLASAGIVCAHAAEPQAILLRSIEEGQRILLNKLVTLGCAHAQRIAAALQGQEELRSVIVLPRARVHRAAPQPHDDRHVLNAHRALELARPARRALKGRLLRVVFAQQRLLRSRAKLVQVRNAIPARLLSG